MAAVQSAETTLPWHSSGGYLHRVGKGQSIDSYSAARIAILYYNMLRYGPNAI